MGDIPRFSILHRAIVPNEDYYICTDRMNASEKFAVLGQSFNRLFCCSAEISILTSCIYNSPLDPACEPIYCFHCLAVHLRDTTDLLRYSVAKPFSPYQQFALGDHTSRTVNLKCARYSRL